MLGESFEYHSEAMQEAFKAFEWYARQDETVADRFWEELRRARRSVTSHPKSWMPYLYGTRCFLLKKFPFALVYIERDDKIIGIAVAHLKRRPGYWRKRLAD
jgi:plasmid stabilization system protein ParE